jgi:hypothetical protein
MNEYRKPTIGTVAHSNKWDAPGTFRLINVQHGPFEVTISLDRIEYIKVVNTSKTSDKPLVSDVASFEIEGSKGDIYIVTLDGDKSKCTCPAGTHGRECKHVKKAREELHS